MGLLIEHLPSSSSSFGRNGGEAGFQDILLLPGGGIGVGGGSDPVTSSSSSSLSSTSTKAKAVNGLDRRLNTEILVHAEESNPPVSTSTSISTTTEQKLHYHSQSHAKNRIPKILIFTHSVNLLTYEPSAATASTTTQEGELPKRKLQDDSHNNHLAAAAAAAEATSTPEQQQQQKQIEELLTLQRNVRKIIEMHPDADQIRFLTDHDCIRALQAVLGPNAPLIHYFQQETQGMYKADICRGAALWETGGIYLDVDVGVRMSLWGDDVDNSENMDVTATAHEDADVEADSSHHWNEQNQPPPHQPQPLLHDNTTFATNFVHRDSNYIGHFFQAFMAVTPHHAIIERYLHLFLLHYQGKLTHPIKKGPLGVILLRQAFDDVVAVGGGGGGDGGGDEIVAVDSKPFHTLTDREKQFRLGPTIIDTLHYGRFQIWQEVQYQPKYFPNVPAPTWGVRRACHFVVVANKKFPLMVPFYSRIAGSRICPVSSTVPAAEITSSET